MKKKKPKKRNPIANALKNPAFKQRKIPSKKQKLLDKAQEKDDFSEGD